MTDKWHGGKGDRPRKASNQKAYSDNYERIFGKKDDADLGLEGDTRDEIPQRATEKKEQAKDTKNS